MSKSANKAQLIAEIYEVVLKPESYDDFMALWERHLLTTFSKLEMQHETDISISKHIHDPELEAHFQRAYEILEKLGREGKGAGTPEQFVTQKKEPAFFIAANKKIIHQNKPAKQLLGDIVSLEGNITSLEGSLEGNITSLRDYRH
ncbi:MAG: hypothetical protein L3J15_08540 [Devosiaceae bacterium]|nr:hypothetical protein [Devosiaceae bacterium]